MEYQVDVYWAGGKGTKQKRAARQLELFREVARAFPDGEYAVDRTFALRVRTSRKQLGEEIFRFLEQRLGDSFSLDNAEEPTPQDIAHARFIPVEIGADLADCERSWKLLNPYPVVLCDKCWHVKEPAVPEPFVVANWVHQSTQEIFLAHSGLLVVRPRVLDLLLAVVRDQIEWGKARTKALPHLKLPLFWVRPKFQLGTAFIQPAKRCPKCNTLAPWYWARRRASSKESRGLLRPHFVVQLFGPEGVDIAVHGGSTGNRQSETFGIVRELFVSGGLFGYLYNSGVKGLVFPRRIVHSKKNEPSLVKIRRYAELTPGRGDRIVQRKPEPWRAVGKLVPVKI